MAASTLYGRLLIVGKEGCADLEFPIDKSSVLIGRQVAAVAQLSGAGHRLWWGPAAQAGFRSGAIHV